MTENLYTQKEMFRIVKMLRLRDFLIDISR